MGKIVITTNIQQGFKNMYYMQQYKKSEQSWLK